MNNLASTCLLILLNFPVLAQDWLTWGFKYEFKIENNGLVDYTFLSSEVSVNIPFKDGNYQGGGLSYDNNTSIYTLNLSYGCISCGYGGAPPSVYFRMYLFDEFYNEYLSIIIPISFDETEEKNYFNLGTIYLHDFISRNYTHFEGIKVKKDGTIYKYKRGEYNFPYPQKLYRIK